MPTLAYSTSTGRVRRGWDAFDRDVLSTFRDAHARSFTEVVNSLPTGLHFTDVRGSLNVLVHLGLLTGLRDTGPWELTDAGLDRLTGFTTTRKAA